MRNKEDNRIARQRVAGTDSGNHPGKAMEKDIIEAEKRAWVEVGLKYRADERALKGSLNEAFVCEPTTKRPPEKTFSQEDLKTEISNERAGDYIIRLHNVDSGVSAGMREFIRRTPSIRLIILSTCENDIQLNIRLEADLPLVQALSAEFPACHVARLGQIILIKKNESR